MTEQEYILVSDLRSVRVAKQVLHDVVAENNTSVPDDEYRTVLDLLKKWESAMYARLKVD